MLMLAWVLRVLLILLVVRYVVRLLNGPATTARRRAAPRASERVGGTLVRDPQCGTYVPESGALTLQRGNATLHFCSAACRDAWTLAHPK